MRVNYVKTKGFRKFKDIFETNLYDITNITGKNRSGKSNILYAIINIMLGTNLSGDEKMCLINKDCESSYGEIRFTDNDGIEHTLIRVKNKFSNKGNVLSLDGKCITQTELIKYYKDKKLFLSIINPLYFLSKKPAEQKELVDKYISDIKPKEVFDTLNEIEQNKLIKKYYKNNEVNFKELSESEKENFINSTILNICMDIAYNKLNMSEQNILEGIPYNVQKYISDLNEDIKRNENNIYLLDGKIEYAKNIVNEKIPEYKNFEKEEELLLQRQEYYFLKNNKDIEDKENQIQIIQNLEKEFLTKETEFKEHENSMKRDKLKYISIKNGSSSICPTCEQIVKDESKNKTIENMRNELLNSYNKKNILEAELNDVKIKLGIERCKYHALEGNVTVEKSKRIDILEKSIKQLEKEQLEVENFNNEIATKEKNINKAKADIEKFMSDKKNYANLINSLNKAKKVAQKLYILYIEEKMKLAKKYLKLVDIKYYNVLKTTGEIKEDFIITYNNKSLIDLSRSEKIATALEFANMFNKISKANFPIFIDDYESCVDYDFVKKYSKDTQIIVAKVEKRKPLKIANSKGDIFTIIKPVIKGFNTMKTENSNVAQILHAA